MLLLNSHLVDFFIYFSSSYILSSCSFTLSISCFDWLYFLSLMYVEISKDHCDYQIESQLYSRVYVISNIKSISNKKNLAHLRRIMTSSRRKIRNSTELTIVSEWFELRAESNIKKSLRNWMKWLIMRDVWRRCFFSRIFLNFTSLLADLLPTPHRIFIMNGIE